MVNPSECSAAIGAFAGDCALCACDALDVLTIGTYSCQTLNIKV